MMTSIQPSYGLPSSASANPKYEPPYKRSKVSSGTWVVRNVRENTFDPDEYALKSANVFEQVLQSVFSGIPLPGSLTKLTVSKRVETIVRLGRGYSFTLYTQMRRNCQAHVNRVLKSRLIASLRSQAQNGAEFASLILQAWEDWSQKLSNLREIFSFLDQAYCRRSFEKGVVEIMQMGADIFRDSIGLDDMIKPHLISGILASFDRSATHDEEMSEVHIFRDHGPGKKHVEMMQSLAMYRPHFESAYLESTTAFAKAKAQEIAGIEDRSSASGYVQSYLALEANRAECIKLEIETLTKALDIITIHLVNNLSTYWTARSAFDALVVSGDSAALSRINTLFARNGLEDELAIPWSEACLTAGRSILDKPQEDVVQRLLELKADLDQLLATCFLGRQNLAVSMRKSFELFMNERRPGEAWSTNNSKIAEMIAKYVDRLLRDGPKAIAVRRQQQLQGDDEVDESNDMKSDDRELERALDSGLDLFRFVRGKDVFEAFYKKDLAKRLLLNRSASDAAEQYMMGVLRNECGDAFTQNLEMMFKDVDLAKDTNTGFKELEEKAGGSSNGVDLSVQVLSSAAWPTYQELQLSIPSSIGRQLQRFKEYYGTKHKGRNLVWRHLMSHAILRANLPGGYKELQVSALQAAVLLMFEDATNEDALSYDAIAMGTQLGGPQLMRTLQSLSCGKVKILRKSSKGIDIKENDKFTVNQSFTNKNYRIKINQIQLRETEQENKETHERVASDRQFEIQAAIVRTMKSKQLISHNELVSEIIKALSGRGSIEISEIKANIEKLIEKEYIEREDNRYKYIS